MISHREPAQLYDAPLVCLPADSAFPLATDACTTPTRDVAALAAIIESANRITRHLQEAVVTPAQLAQLTAPLGQAVTVVTTMLAQRNDQLTAAPPSSVAQDFSPVLAAACAIYDDYFGVVRVEELTLAQFTGQFAHTCLALLPDLPYTLQDRAQILQLLAGMTQMFIVLADKMQAAQGQITQGQGAQDFGAAGQQIAATTTLYQQRWQAADPADRSWQERVAFYRWKVGHHFFNWCAIFCREALLQAQAAIARDAHACAVTHLGQAEICLRGSTAAMWYAGDFPAQLYQTVIRPSMIMPDAPAGFSGDQNADYNRMKSAKQGLKDFLRSRYGQDLATLPAPVRQALLQFHAADIEDNEHHLLIAAQKVGSDQSLAQKEWQAELPEHIYRQSALDILRHMAELKRREFA